MEDDAGETGAIRAAVRSAKKTYKPAKIGEVVKKPTRPSAVKKQQAKKRRPSGTTTFGKDLEQRPVREGVRAKKGDVIGGMGKKKGGKRKGK